MATKKSIDVEKDLEVVVLEDAVTDTAKEMTVAERFLAKEVKIANEVGLNPKRKLHLEMVRGEVAKARKEDK